MPEVLGDVVAAHAVVVLEGDVDGSGVGLSGFGSDTRIVTGKELRRKGYCT